jgi:hypothetical protein
MLHISKQTNGQSISYSVAVWLRVGQDPESDNEQKVRITWTIKQFTNASGEWYWESINYFSTLPYGWIPDDGVDFLKHFILYLEQKWLEICSQGEKHLNERVS